jgi:hypothetical protein
MSRSQYDFHTAHDPNADDMAPSLAEARSDEAAMRRRWPVPREPARDGVVDLVEALDRAVRAAQRAHRGA